MPKHTLHRGVRCDLGLHTASAEVFLGETNRKHPEGCDGLVVRLRRLGFAQLPLAGEELLQLLGGRMLGGATQYVGKPGLRIGPRYSERSCASLNSS